MKRLVFTFGLGIMSLLSFSQQGKLTLKGEVNDQDGNALEGFQVIVIDQETNDTIQLLHEDKRCKIDLDLDHEYKVAFSKAHYLYKYFTVSTDKTRYKNYKFDFEVILGASHTATDFEESLGHVKYNYGMQEFEHSPTQTRQRRRAYNTFLVTSNP